MPDEDVPIRTEPGSHSPDTIRKRPEVKGLDALAELLPGTLQIDSVGSLFVSGAIDQTKTVPFLGCIVRARFLGLENRRVRMELEPADSRLFRVVEAEVTELTRGEDGVFEFDLPCELVPVDQIPDEHRPRCYLAAASY